MYWRYINSYICGKYSVCGYNKCMSSLNFHHKKQITKKFGISQKTMAPLKVIKPELDKCILMCDNCHEETHHTTRILYS